MHKNTCKCRIYPLFVIAGWNKYLNRTTTGKKIFLRRWREGLVQKWPFLTVEEQISQSAADRTNQCPDGLWGFDSAVSFPSKSINVFFFPPQFSGEIKRSDRIIYIQKDDPSRSAVQVEELSAVVLLVLLACFTIRRANNTWVVSTWADTAVIFISTLVQVLFLQARLIWGLILLRAPPPPPTPLLHRGSLRLSQTTATSRSSLLLVIGERL